MTNAIGATNVGYGIYGTLVNNAVTVHQQLNTLLEQASSGLVAQTYAGLGSSANLSLSLNLQVNTLQTYQTNIDQAVGTMQVTQTAMKQLQQVAATFVAHMPNLSGVNSSEVDSIAADARSALAQVANLLDTKDGNIYVFAGQDSGNPPVPNADNILSSGFYTQINAAVSTLSNSTTATTLNIASSNAAGTSPFSTYLSQSVSSIAGRTVQVGSGSTVTTGLLASANTTASSTGPSTTGSYMRDLMRALATLGSLSSSQVNDPNFASVVQDTWTSLNGAVDAMALDVGVFGTTQSNLTTTQTQLSDTATALTGQISNVQDVDMASVLSQLAATQTQLQESYKLIASQNSMSLVNFLPSA